ncbi:transketolase [Pelotomaculum propionicicum]|uniref:Transketolase n=1 Tax=Pelotomaculum propionicicum TaxID=258475 RepID=A0A4Y7RLZ8_9FIRM|nr:transketolase [Pelotomaculum propionicicum]TEB09841.1 Transketolase [Pelotomaculum propionicicum]
MKNEKNDLELLCINTLRMLAVDMVEKAKSGHPGMPMGAAPMAFTLWTRFMRHNPQRPSWPNRDRFVLSAGHGSALLYALLHLNGYELTLDDLKNFRQWDSKTPGHPEYGHTPGVEVTTGPLGQGIANAVGIAAAERFMAAYFNRPGYEVVDYYTYVIAGDGDLMEGVSHEAASLAGHLKLGKLICLYDDNRISIEGSTELAFTEDRAGRFAAYGWHVQQVSDGNDTESVAAAIQAAQAVNDKPSMIMVRTHIGYGSPNKQDSPSAHGEPLGVEEVKNTKEKLGWPQEPDFFVPEQVWSYFRNAVAGRSKHEQEWQSLFSSFAQAYPELAVQYRQWVSGRLPEGWDKDLVTFPADQKGVASRAASGTVLNDLAARLPNLVGGSADLAPSNKTIIKGAGDFSPADYSGRNFHFGVREHGMGSILNGMALDTGLIPYGGTFLVFAEYMRPAIRMAAMMQLKVIYVFTHDSIGLGEDGPTHQPVEQLVSLRAIPGLTVIRPADANETAIAWRCALGRKKGPTALILSRQNLPTLDRQQFSPADGLVHGAYQLNRIEDKKPDLILIASGSEVHLALQAAAKIKEKDVLASVVSMPSWELFEEQTEEYRRRVLPPEITARVAIEAGSTLGWRRYTGDKGEIIGIDHFGASAPAGKLFEKFGFTADNIVKKALSVLDR